MLTHQSGLFWGYKIACLRVCWPLKFLHALEIHLGLLEHTPNWDGVPLKILRANIKNFRLKFSVSVCVQCFTSPPTQYRLYGRRFLQVKRPNQQHQSTEGRSTKDKENNENN